MGKRLWTEWQPAFPEFNPLFSSSWMQFLFVTIVPTYLNFATLSKDLVRVFMSWFFPVSCSWDVSIYFVFTVFTSRPMSLRVTNKASMFFIGLMFLPKKLSSSEEGIIYVYAQ
jgi:hypothetical protein